jgi:hypothetical protein
MFNVNHRPHGKHLRVCGLLHGGEPETGHCIRPKSNEI